MTHSIERLTKETLRHDLDAVDLARCLEDFKRRADPHGLDGWTAGDFTWILEATIGHQQNATWIVFVDNIVSGFQVLCFGQSMQKGKLEGQILAFYLKPGSPLMLAPTMVAVMKDHARKLGAFRIIGGTQRDVLRAFKRLGAVPFGVLYQIPIEEDQPSQSYYQS